ncbi:hypothetical protein LSUE1_G004595 [Lachnellula suecica]|uniref:Uncharacterized protein n=1 Tax=Lachnellula suecica TaxID=602035 RepID=A0A8T9CAV8_9HELO|nr:hypothetical protein LSUE1_G004595 [Lachnellula suecica]
MQPATNWLRMPTRELGSSLETPNGVQGVGTTLLKKHKILPHPREQRLPEFFPSTPATRPRDLVIDTGISSTTSSDTSSPHTLKHASKKIGGLPPTPPTHSRQSSGSHLINTSAPRYDLISSKTSANIPSVPSTPPNQRSPPTPDVTPPRAMPFAFRPPVNDRYPSSRADSFKTARESPYMSDEDEASTVRPVIPSARQSATEVQQLPGRPQKHKEIGLGLGLESDNEGGTTPRALAGSSQAEFYVFDGEWGSEVEPEWDDYFMRNVTVRKRPGRQSHMFTDGANDEVIEDDIVSPTDATKVVRSLPLQERIARRRLERDTDQISNHKSTQRITSWPSAGVGPDSPATPDVRRFSAMSGRSAASTVVEAMVVDALPKRRQTLRHIKKQSGLRDVSSDQSTLSSGPNSVVSTSLSSEPHRDSRHRLHHSTGRIPETRHRSLGSTITVSSASSSGKSRREILKNGGIPVVVIPERRSSSKPSKPRSLRSTSSHRRSNSLASAPLSQSSKFNEPGYFDSVAPRKRTMSESAGDGNSIRTIDFPPTIPARRSSLSAPTSRNTSRAGSLTAESLKAHNMIQAKKLEPAGPEPVHDLRPELPKDWSSYSSHLNVDHNGDPFFGNRLSTQVTPFSQVSYETAGTSAEVSEAMAVSIFPHQNKSVLVVQQLAPSEPSLPALKANNAARPAPPSMTVNGKATGPVTPPQPIHPMDEVDSPLRNPRVPPEPPKITFIPPTPAVLTPGQEEERQLGFDFDERPTTSDSKSKRGVSLMRRAFSNRRNSETAIQLSPGFLKRTFSLSGRRKESADGATQTAGGVAKPSTVYPTVEDRPADGSKLHPFWRPSHFWDDLDDEFADDELGYPIIDNRPSPPKRSLSGKLKRTFAILPLKDDHEHQPYAMDRREMRKSSNGTLRVVKQRSNNTLRRESSDRRLYAEVPEGSFGHGFKEGNGGKRIHTIPGTGVRVEYIGWSGMKRRISEKRRLQRSEKLRATISNPREVQSGVDDVLRRRRQSRI